MKYLGGKSRLSKKFCYILDESLKNNSGIFVEPFVGGCNIVPNLNNYKSSLCIDIHKGLINLYNDILSFNISLPEKISNTEYDILKNKKEDNSISTFISFGSSFGGKEWGGYARGKNNNGYERNYCLESKKSILKKFKKIKKNRVFFKHGSYHEFDLKNLNCTIYCDPPYKDTTGYKTGKFNHDEFYEWAETQKKHGNDIFVSEFQAPSHWEIVWELERKITSTINNYKTKTDKLFKV